MLEKLRSFTKRPLLAGTMILTLTGLASRLIGFFYRIYLSRLFGEENLGLYQLISPVIALSFSFTAAGYQTAVSKLTAEFAARSAACQASFGKPGAQSTSDTSSTPSSFGKPNTPSISNMSRRLSERALLPISHRPMLAALSISLPLSALCTAATYFLADPIGTFLLGDSRTVPLLRIISFSFPFVGIHACINGWFYGMKKAGLPSLAQIIEQLTRVGCVFFITMRDVSLGKSPDISTAVFGLALGEFVSMTVAIVTYLPYVSCLDQRPLRPPHSSAGEAGPSAQSPWTDLYHGLLAMALPLTANRMTLTFLGSLESVAIPAMLRLYGYTSEGALSVYGVLTGMALPLIFFPNALTGSIAVMLLPMISENFCLHKMDAVRALTLQALKWCLLMGLACLSVFVLFGPWLGTVMFHSALAGRCIRTLGWICPFLYLDVTLSSILQGLGKAGTVFAVNLLSLFLRLAFVYLAVPIFGIRGFLWGMLAGQLLLTGLYGLTLAKVFTKKEPQTSLRF